MSLFSWVSLNLISHAYVMSLLMSSRLRFDKLRFNKPRMIWNLERYGASIAFRAAPLKSCIGFVDGTDRKIARPSVIQGVFYSGHKHYHSIKFQSWVTPDGLISHFFGPIPGHRHDMWMWWRSKLEDDILSLQEFDQYCIFGDQGYKSQGHPLSPIPGLIYLILILPISNLSTLP